MSSELRGGRTTMADTLYETVGGRLKINAAVELFYQKVLADESLRPFFEKVGMNHLRERQSMFVSMLLGGRVVYSGKDIHAAHEQPRKMGMTEAHFDIFLKYFRESLEEVGVLPERLDKIIGLLQASRDAVLKR
jgi:truncated hemoglobin YjbI